MSFQTNLRVSKVNAVSLVSKVLQVNPVLPVFNVSNIILAEPILTFLQALVHQVYQVNQAFASKSASQHNK